ncbi:MAG: ferredoxin [Desulfobacteraceae bacterium]|nr:ferredoxin [Desulfobacteraceae bacterium]
MKILSDKKTPVVDLSTCILCEICTELAPHAFRINDAGFVDVLSLDDYSDEDIHEVVKNCPKDCITWE